MDDNFKIPSSELIKKPTQQKKPENEKLGEKDLQQPSQSQQGIPCPYKVPKWAKKPEGDDKYYFEVLKNGTIIEQIEAIETKSHWVFGRLNSCDFVLAHPTISRFHCILQWKPENSADADDETETAGSEKKQPEKGWYLYDLNSTHGSFLNKFKIVPYTYVRIRVGHMIRLGNSSRTYIFCGPPEDEEMESELTVTQIKEEKLKKDLERAENERKQIEEMQRLEKQKQAEGINWGMSEDAVEEPDLSINPYATTANEELFLDDPKKTLRGFFEREGFDLEYKCEELSPGSFICKIELPIDDEFGRAIFAEVAHKGKKKDCVVQCAMEACRILDRNGVLRQANPEPRKRKQHQSDSDGEDDFFDRTGDIEKKRLKKEAAGQSSAFTYDELLVQEQELIEKIKCLEAKMDDYKNKEKGKRDSSSDNQEDDDLDAFMTNLQSNESKMDDTDVKKLRIEIQSLRNDQNRLKKMISIATPINLPPIKPVASTAVQKPKLPLFGKRPFLDKKFGIKKTEVLKPVQQSAVFTEEFDDDEGPSESNAKEVQVKGPQVTPEIIKSVQKIDAEKIETVTESEKCEKKEEVVTDEPETVELKGQESSQQVEEKTPSIDQKPSQSTEEASQSTEEGESSKKKKRNRQRNRDRARDNVDVDEIYDEEKVSKWVAPEDQTGDGITALNEKYGY